ncbi:MAG: flavin reductase family protein [Bacteroidales bacterium]|nr:flavin reductase family protein [Bacteroidales bacterium]MCF8333850.1 flavin reductase family protein [Bacteroidales bacterium]
MRKIDPTQINHTDLHKIILGTIGPRPIAFASTVDKKGKPNLSPFSYFNAFGVNPSTLIFSPARRGRDNTTKHTYENIKEVPEVVINVVTYDIVQQASLSSTGYEKGVNEFVKAGLTAEPSEKIRPYRVKESPVQYECKVREVIETGDQGGAGNLVICEIVYVHIREDLFDENGAVDQTKIDLVGRMGGNYYVRAHGDALFEVEKPLAKKGIGIDQLPEKIRNSEVLTGNDLGRLGNIEQLPGGEELKSLRKDKAIAALIESYDHDKELLRHHLHTHAKKLLDQGEFAKALRVLML